MCDSENLEELETVLQAFEEQNLVMNSTMYYSFMNSAKRANDVNTAERVLEIYKVPPTTCAKIGRACVPFHALHSLWRYPKGRPFHRFIWLLHPLQKTHLVFPPLHLWLVVWGVLSLMSFDIWGGCPPVFVHCICGVWTWEVLYLAYHSTSPQFFCPFNVFACKCSHPVWNIIPGCRLFLVVVKWNDIFIS